MHQEVLKTRPFHTTLKNFHAEFIEKFILKYLGLSFTKLLTINHYYFPQSHLLPHHRIAHTKKDTTKLLFDWGLFDNAAGVTNAID